MSHFRKLTLAKSTERRVSKDTLQGQLEYIVDRAVAGERGSSQKWSLSSSLKAPEPEPNSDGWLYRTTLKFEKGRNADEGIIDRQFENLKYIADLAGRSGGWRVSDLQVAKLATPTPKSVNKVEQEVKIVVVEPSKPLSNGKDFAPLNLNPNGHFSNLFGREAQVKMALAALSLAQDTGFEKRKHICLYGAPGGGKTEFCRCLKAMIGVEAYLEFDATTMTAAGAIRLMTEAASVPPVVIFEEPEKAPEEHFNWLLSALDDRGEINKVTYRGSTHRETKFLAIACINDIQEFEKRQRGALNSRFSTPIFFPAPDDVMLREILFREVKQINGNLAWVEPAIRYCVDVEGVRDPRRAITLCLLGREGWLDGTFIKTLEACKPPSGWRK